MHITISGKLGSGKSTVCKILNSKGGFEMYSTGAIQRKIADDLGLSTLEMNKLMCRDNSYDHMIDDAVAKISECTDHQYLFDSRMAWHFAKNSFRVFMYVDPGVAAVRVYEDNRGDVEKYSSVEDAKNKLMERTMNENSRFIEIYNADNLNYDNYDLVIDSTAATPERVAEIILSNFDSFQNRRFEKTKVYLCPTALYPTEPINYSAGADELPGIAVYDHYNYCVANPQRYFEALKRGDVFIECTHTRSGSSALDKPILKSVYDEYEREAGVEFISLPDRYL